MEEKVKAEKSMAGTAAVVAAMLAFVLMPHRAWAMTADGALMTNTAFATFSGIAGQAVSYRTSYLASSNVLICNPLIGYIKTATPTMAAPTATVTFTVCTINNSTTTSAFNVVLTDQIPGNMGSIAEVSKWPAGTITTTYAAALAGPWTAGFPSVVGQTSSFLRWTVGQINVGPGRSACITYTASVL